MMTSITRKLIGTAVITASVWTVSPARAEIPVPTDDAGNEPASAGEGAPSGEKGAFPAAVLGKLHLMNIQQIMMGKRVEKKGQSKEVRDFGALLVRDHSAADKRLLAFAKRQKLDVSVTGQTLEEPDLGASGTFDEKLTAFMRDQHEKTIAEVKSSREASTDDTLNAFLDSMVPMLERHRDMAQEILDRRSKR